MEFRLWGEAMRQRIKGWPGYVHVQKDGRPLFVIERQVTVDGTRHRFHLSTGCHTIGAAMKQLERFEADPFGYSRAGGDVRAPLLLTADLIERLYDFQIAAGNTPKYTREVSTWLAKWVVDLRGRDLRRLSLAEHVLPALDKRTPGARRPMKAALKTLFTWLREERHEITMVEDIGRELQLEQSNAAKRAKRVAHDIAHVRKVMGVLTGVYRDALLFQWATSCHVTELERFVREERSRLVVYEKPTRLPDGVVALAHVELWHKVKEWHQVALTRPEHVEAAKRLRKRGGLPTRHDLNATIYAACDFAKVPRMSFVMRHSTLTRAAKRGISEERRMKHARHKNVATTRRYVDLDLPEAAIPAERI